MEGKPSGHLEILCTPQIRLVRNIRLLQHTVAVSSSECERGFTQLNLIAVSYTHLDVYKRQLQTSIKTYYFFFIRVEVMRIEFSSKLGLEIV